MAVLSSAQRRRLPSSSFAVPSKAPGPGSYPMPDRAHAGNAKSRAAQFASPSVKAAVNAKANRILGKGKKRKKMTPREIDDSKQDYPI